MQTLAERCTAVASADAVLQLKLDVFCYVLLQVINVLAEFKYGITRWLLLHTNLFVAWLFNTVVSLALVGGSSALVVGWAPAAVSSGVPEVMAYLNGILLPKVRVRPSKILASTAHSKQQNVPSSPLYAALICGNSARVVGVQFNQNPAAVGVTTPLRFAVAFVNHVT
jgi:hypothetical protein